MSKNCPDKVCRLLRSIYGLKQAFRSWNIRFDEAIRSYDFVKNEDEPCVYRKVSESAITFLVLYVDDILIIGNDVGMISIVKAWLYRHFSMKDLGEASYILGIRIYRDRSKRMLGLSQSRYIETIVKRFGMKNSKRCLIPMRHGISLSTSMSPKTPEERANIEHWKAVKCILKYLRRTKDLLLVYGGNSLKVEGYTDSSFQSNVDDSKSNSRFVYTLNGRAVCWKSFKQDTTADSTTEAEYIATLDVAKEGVWVKKFITYLGVVPGSEEPISLYCDNNGAITQIRELGSHQKCSEEVPTYQRDRNPRRCSSGKSSIRR